MLKSDLVHVLVDKRGITQKQAEQAVETIFEAMRDALCDGDNIEIRGFGAFHVKQYKGYQGRNPKTGEVIPVAPKRGILFRTGKELRERINDDFDPDAHTRRHGGGLDEEGAENGDGAAGADAAEADGSDPRTGTVADRGSANEGPQQAFASDD